MKSLLQTLTNGLIMSLILTGATVRAQSVNPETDNSTEKQSFELSTYMGAKQTVNLMLAVYESKGVTLQIKDTDDTILYVLHLRKSRKAYHQKLSFEGSKPGTYRLEISDGQKTVVRRIDVVDIPAIESQRYVTYSAQLNR